MISADLARLRVAVYTHKKRVLTVYLIEIKRFKIKKTDSERSQFNLLSLDYDCNRINYGSLNECCTKLDSVISWTY